MSSISAATGTWARLVPLPSTNEILLPGVSQRPTLNISHNGTTVILGRNSITKIASLQVAPEVGRVYCKGAVLWYATKGKGNTTAIWNDLTLQYQDNNTLDDDDGYDDDDDNHGSLINSDFFNSGDPEHVNNNNSSSLGTKRRLREGDVVSLLPLQSDYRYKVVILEQKLMQDPLQRRQSPTMLTVDDTTTTTNSTASRSAWQQATAEELMCAICIDICVKATILVPCGHVYCQLCARDVQDCPTCRSRIRERMDCPTLDHIIWNLMQSPDAIFDEEDVKHYLKRTGKTLPVRDALSPPRKRLKPSLQVTPSIVIVDKPVVLPQLALDLTMGSTANEAICLFDD